METKQTGDALVTPLYLIILPSFKKQSLSANRPTAGTNQASPIQKGNKVKPALIPRGASFTSSLVVASWTQFEIRLQKDVMTWWAHLKI
jgi:hypothetical protein